MAGEQQLALDESTTDPVALQAMFARLDAGDEPAPLQTEEERLAEAAAAEAAAKATQEAEAAAAAAKNKEAETAPPAVDGSKAAQDAAQAEADAAGVATRDGKHVIPYSVLQAERERATSATKALEAANTRLAELEATAKATPGVKTEPADPSKAKADDLSDEDLAILKEDFPSVYKGLMAQKAVIAELEKRFEPVQKSVEQQAEQRQRTVDEQVRDAIDATPKLAHLKVADPEQFNLAAQFDTALKTQPEWAGKPLAERFAKAIEMVEAVKGVIVIPGAAAPDPAPATKTPDQLKAEAQAIAAASAKASKTAAPASLSDFASGDAAATDEAAKVNTMTTADLARKFANMSPSEMDAYLSTL